MYDLQIFIEDNGQYGAKVQINNEIIYALGDTPEELVNEIKEIINKLNLNKQSKYLVKFLNLFSPAPCH